MVTGDKDALCILFTTSVYVALACAGGEAESLTVTTTLYEPATVGVPPMKLAVTVVQHRVVPPQVFRAVEIIKPGGKDAPGAAAQLKVYGATPPVARICQPKNVTEQLVGLEIAVLRAPYSTPTIPFGNGPEASNKEPATTTLIGEEWPVIDAFEASLTEIDWLPVL